jgi:HSP20 family protein
MFSDLYTETHRAWVPPVDIFETADHEVVIKAEVPEVRREDLKVTFENDILTIVGERKTAETSGSEQLRRSERRYGSFERSFTIPTTVDAARITASYKDGVLTVRLPRREEAKPKAIAVNIE